MNSLLDTLIEEAAMIWLRERDNLPCSIRRIRLKQMIDEQASPTPTRPPIPSTTPRITDFKSRAANDDTFR